MRSYYITELDDDEDSGTSYKAKTSDVDESKQDSEIVPDSDDLEREIEELGAETVTAVNPATSAGPKRGHIYCAKRSDYWKGYVIFTAVIWKYEKCHLQIAFWQQAVSLSDFMNFICFELHNSYLL